MPPRGSNLGEAKLRGKSGGKRAINPTGAQPLGTNADWENPWARMPNGKSWWRWKIRDRTELNQEFSCLIPLEQNWEYKRIQKEAVRWHEHGLSYVKIARLLGVTDKTVKKAIEKSRDTNYSFLERGNPK